MKKGMQKLIYDVIKLSCVDFGNKFITRSEIIKEVSKTSYGHLGKKKLTQKVEQAIYQLHDKMLIYSKGYGKWGIPKKDNPYSDKYQPRICQALKKTPGGWFCPIRNIYIANPAKQCELLHDVNTDDMSKVLLPMKSCYFRSKPTEEEIEFMSDKIKEIEELEKSKLINEVRVRGY